MVERGDQQRVLGAEQAVAEDVARHVADADAGEVLGLTVDAALAEVALHRDPGATGGDAHRLVVVAHRAAGRERVAQPEAVVVGDAVGDVGEGGGALVGRDHEVGVVGVVAYDALRRHVLAVHEVVGDVEQPADEGLVAGDPLGQPGVAVGRVGQLLAEEAALGADGHDHGVLHHLRLDQAEHLGAEVVAAVGPAQAASRDRAEAEVHALDPRRVDEDLEARPRLRQVGDLRRLELEGHVGVVLAVLTELEVVGPQRRADVRQVGAQDPVVVEAGDVVERPLDPGDDLVDPRGPGLGVGGDAVASGVEARLEELHEHAGDVGVAAQRLLDVVDGERAVALLHVLGVRAQHRGLAPGQPGTEHQGVEAVDLVEALPHGADGVLERLAHVVGHAGGVAQPELVDVRRPVDVVELVGPLVDDLDAHRRQRRQDLRQRDRRAAPEDLQPRLAAGGVERREQRQVGAGLAEGLEPAEVERAGGGREVLLVGLGEGRLEGAGEARTDVLAELGDGGGGEVVAPRTRGIGEPALELGDVDVGNVHALGRVDHEVDPRRRRLAHPHRELDGLAAEAGLEDLGESLADAGVVAVAGQEDQDADIAPVGVATYEDAQLPSPAGLHDPRGHRRQLVDRGVEQLVARVGLEGVDEGLAGMAVGIEADLVEDVLRSLAQQRDPPHRLGVGRTREEAEEPTLADDLTGLVEHLHPDVVEVRRAVDGGAGVGLGQHQQGVLAGHLGDLGRQLAGRRRHVGVVAQDAVPGAGHAAQVVALLVALEVVLAVAEEGEVVGAQPFEEGDAPLELLGGDRGGRVSPQLLDDHPCLLAHPAPVLDRLPDVTQHPLHVEGDRRRRPRRARSG